MIHAIYLYYTIITNQNLNINHINYTHTIKILTRGETRKRINVVKVYSLSPFVAVSYIREVFCLHIIFSLIYLIFDVDEK